MIAILHNFVLPLPHLQQEESSQIEKAENKTSC